MSDPFVGYDGNLDTLVSNQAVPFSRPAAVTGLDGTYVLFVAGDNNIYSRAINSTTDNQISNTGNIWSIAISPDGRYLAYTSTDLTDNNIYVYDYETQTGAAHALVPADFSEDGSANLNTIRYADAMSFDHTGRTLVFDALNCVSAANSSCASGGGYQYWSIGFLNVVTAKQEYPFPDQSPGEAVGNPSFAQNNSYVVLSDYSDGINSALIAIDFQNQLISAVWSYTGVQYGVGSFWGDDSHVTFQKDGGAFRVAVDGQWIGDAASLTQLNDYAVNMPLMHRAGIRDTSGSLSLNAASHDFGEVAIGSNKGFTVTLTNDGIRDVNISQMASDSISFTHNGSGMLLPRGASVDLRLVFAPVVVTGAESGIITITSDATPDTLQVSLSGTSIGKCGTQGSQRNISAVTYISGDVLTCSATSSIVAGPVVSVDAGANVTYQAPSIVLYSGFSVKADGIFRAAAE